MSSIEIDKKNLKEGFEIEGFVLVKKKTFLKWQKDKIAKAGGGKSRWAGMTAEERKAAMAKVRASKKQK